MYVALGDREKQAAIREATPHARHCVELEVNPRFCNGCPKNPYKRRSPVAADDMALIKPHSDDIEKTVERIALREDVGVTFAADSLPMRDARMIMIARGKLRQIAEEKRKKDG